MSQPPPLHHRVHFQTTSPSHQQKPTTSTNPSSSSQPWSERHIKLSKLLKALTNSNHLNLNHHINSSNHFNIIHHQQQHDLNSQFGLLIEHSNKLLNQKSQSHQQSSTEIRLLERVIKCQLDPNLDFITIRELSSSECGKVELVKSRLSKDESRNQRNVYVLKTIYKSAAIRMREHISADAELAILQLSRSSETNRSQSTQGILPTLRASFQSPDALYILTSYLPGGTLSDLISQRQALKSNSIRDHQYEHVVKQWTVEIVLGLDWLHTRHHWVHRDLKPSNILLSLEGHIVLNDFGTAAPLIEVKPPLRDEYHWEKYQEEIVYEFSRWLVPKRFSRTLVGTCDYIAPEVLHSHLHTVMDIMESDPESTTPDHSIDDHQVGGLYGNEVDWWSLGVTVYELLYGTLPFYSSAISTTYEMIVSHQSFLSFPNSSEMIPTCNVSFDAKDFIKSLLTDPCRRLGCDSTGVTQIQNHAWFKGIDWSTIRTMEPIYKPINGPVEIDPEEMSMGIPASGVPGKAAGAFNFSAFFASSPGLSVLRSMKKPNTHQQMIEEEAEERTAQDEMFDGFTLLPNRMDEFEKDEGIGLGLGVGGNGEKRLKSSLSSGNRMGMIQDGFITPIRPKFKLDRNGIGGTGSGTGRQGRGMSDLEEWKELVDFVTMTAQKKKTVERCKAGLDSKGGDRRDEFRVGNLKFKETIINFKEVKGEDQLKSSLKEFKMKSKEEERNEDLMESKCEKLVNGIDQLIGKYEGLFKYLEDEDYK